MPEMASLPNLAQSEHSVGKLAKYLLIIWRMLRRIHGLCWQANPFPEAADHIGNASDVARQLHNLWQLMIIPYLKLQKLNTPIEAVEVAPVYRVKIMMFRPGSAIAEAETLTRPPERSSQKT